VKENMNLKFKKIIAPKEQNINSNGCKPVEKVKNGFKNPEVVQCFGE